MAKVPDPGAAASAARAAPGAAAPPVAQHQERAPIPGCVRAAHPAVPHSQLRPGHGQRRSQWGCQRPDHVRTAGMTCSGAAASARLAQEKTQGKPQEKTQGLVQETARRTRAGFEQNLADTQDELRQVRAELQRVYQRVPWSAEQLARGRRKRTPAARCTCRRWPTRPGTGQRPLAALLHQHTARAVVSARIDLTAADLRGRLGPGRNRPCHRADTRVLTRALRPDATTVSLVDPPTRGIYTVTAGLDLHPCAAPLLDQLAAVFAAG
ncbi:hypothetical protein QF030_007675 [Streptomyces rishiriensis]|uniref:Uncharacterized protein n=1 Tax=Streptomyces rishiriensis TaxID=68264 RepID=A0ABU0P274_STRRH|nr:hypothetical protein [Streptomyces rishiriensis]